MNPLTVIDELLKDWASPRVRRLVHNLILLAAIGIGFWLAADGDWLQAAAAIAAAVYAGANRANTSDDEL